MFQALLDEAEDLLGVDLNDDGVIGTQGAVQQGGEQQQHQGGAEQQPQGYDHPNGGGGYQPPPQQVKDSWHSPYQSDVVHEDRIDHAHAQSQQQRFFTANGARCRALFVGINYIGSSAELKGCINDVKTLRTLLRGRGFPLVPNDTYKVLVEDEYFEGFAGYPTKQNIIDGIAWLVEGAHAGDTLFLHYSGHGTSVKDQSGDEEDGMDEALVPLDYKQSGLIRDDDLYDMVVKQLPGRVRLTAILDCCHSGTLLDLPYNFQASQEQLATARGTYVRPENSYRQKKYGAYETQRYGGGYGQNLDDWPDVVMFSGCRDNQTSADVSSTGSFENATASAGTAGGACSNALAETLFLNRVGGGYDLTFVTLLMKMRRNLQKRGFDQVPQLSSTKPVDLYAPFTFYGSFSPQSQ